MLVAQLLEEVDRSLVALARSLADLGLSRMFDPERADFRNLGVPEGTSAMSQLSQTVRLAVDEEGTEASAVTVMVQVVAWPPPRRTAFEMRVDRPFLFAIEDQPSGTLIFLGAVGDPRASERRSSTLRSSFQVPPGTPPEIGRPTSQ